MEIIVASRHFKVRKELKKEIVGEIEKLDRSVNKLNTAEVVLNSVHNKIHVEIIIRGKNLNLKAESETDDSMKSFFLAYKKMRHQLDRRRTKVKNHRAMHIADLEINMISKKAS
jgi:ribosomal subunit interface protein